MRHLATRLSKAATVLALGALAAAGGCASTSRSAQVYTYDGASGGNFVASDSLGSRMMRAETYRQAMILKNTDLASAPE